MTLAASFASGIPVAFDTNGTVREERGLASRTYGISSRTASWTLSSPRMRRASAMRVTASSITASSVSESVDGGMAQVESPE